MSGTASPSAAGRRTALLLLGPTGSGKTPLGDHLAAHGLLGRCLRHFDFGSELRRIAAAGGAPGLSAGDMEVIRDSLATGALLENENFPIAARVLDAFVAGQGMQADDWLVLNGLPRHVGQARDVDRLVDVRLVAALECTPEVVLARIRLDSGGDRAGRADDAPEFVRARLATYGLRTAPIVGHYAGRGVPVAHVQVGARTSAAEAAAMLAVLAAGTAAGDGGAAGAEVTGDDQG